VGNLNLTLDFLETSGLIRTVKHGTIITEGGTQASYHTGGTLLIEVSGVQSSSLERVEYGLNVDVKPILDFQDQVKLNIDVEFSQLDEANSVGGDIPSLKDATVVSTVNMQEGQSVLITSQENDEKTVGTEGVWMLSRIPIVGYLFKQRNKQSRDLDNALFVTPRVYDPGSDRHDTMVQGVFERLLDSGAEPKDLPELSDSEKASGNTSGTTNDGELINSGSSGDGAGNGSPSSGGGSDE
jgi:pilus assembly protein CpaC